MTNTSKELIVYLAQPRGFCAGVRRAIAIVENALVKFGPPVYVRHEIVHNKHVIENLRQKGVIFIDEFSEIQDKSRPVVFSAHGISRAVAAEAEGLGLSTIDATCPLVAKVHHHIQRMEQEQREIIVIGKKNHVEIIGTTGQISHPETVHIINSLKEAQSLTLDENLPIGFVTQTTLSVDDTADIITYLKKRYPTIEAMKKDDICFATTNRQKAVKEIAKYADTMIVIGSKNSSNSRQLKETALKSGVKQAFLIDDASEFDFATLSESEAVGITAGASAPEYLVEDLIYQLRSYYDNIKIKDITVELENVNFKL